MRIQSVLVLSSGLVFALGCGDKVIKGTRDGVEYRIVHKKVVGGLQPVEVFVAGVLLAKGSIAEGSTLPRGKWERFHPNGTLAAAGTYVEGWAPGTSANDLACFGPDGSELPAEQRQNSQVVPGCHPFAAEYVLSKVDFYQAGANAP